MQPTLGSTSAPAERTPPVNLTNELAKERNRVAADRTLMAWIRTSLALITFGFGIDKIVAAINRSEFGASANAGLAVLIVSSGFVMIGVGSLIAALVEHRLSLNRLNSDQYLYAKRRSIAGVTAALIVALGILALATIFIGRL